MPARASVRLTANFEANLAQLGDFGATQGAPQVYARLLDDLGDAVLGRLERYPRIGRDFLARSAQSVEARERATRLRAPLGARELREYLFGDYLLLYALVHAGAARARKATVYLLAIKHHRQLGFDPARLRSEV
jgi:hypothetical protein